MKKCLLIAFLFFSHSVFAQDEKNVSAEETKKKYRPPIILWNNFDVELKILENGTMEVEESYSLILDGPVKMIERPFHLPPQSTFSVTNFYLYRPFQKEDSKTSYTQGDLSIDKSYLVSDNKISWRVDNIEKSFNKTPLSFVINYTISNAIKEKDGIWHLSFLLLPPRKNEIVKYFQLKTEIHPNWTPIDPLLGSYVKTNMYPGVDFKLNAKFHKKNSSAATVSSELILTCNLSNDPWEKIMGLYFRGVPTQFLKHSPEQKLTFSMLKQDNQWIIKSGVLGPIPNLAISGDDEKKIGTQTTDLYMTLYLEAKNLANKEVNDLFSLAMLALSNLDSFTSKGTNKMPSMDVNGTRYSEVDMSTSVNRVTVSTFNYKLSITSKELKSVSFSPLSFPSNFKLLIHQTPTVAAAEIPITIADCKTIDL